MYCQRVFFWVFLVVYISTGILLATIAHWIHNTSAGYKQYGSHISHLARYYIGGISLYIIITSSIHIIIGFVCQKRLIFFRAAVIFLILGIIVEIVTVALVFLMRTGIPAPLQKTTLIVISSLTAYLFVLQMYGIIASLSYHSELRHSYEIVSSK
ncbi:unnamed protein product [Adineta ricciae]|uniref:Uncharacterized protein n=1 Tax=Adineta ricciae TaxID=249248 RepID=A0A814Y3S7_ADIRI|nr:unnamed protein product [Adineta ricciae]